LLKVPFANNSEDATSRIRKRSQINRNSPLIKVSRITVILRNFIQAKSENIPLINVSRTAALLKNSIQEINGNIPLINISRISVRINSSDKSIKDYHGNKTSDKGIKDYCDFERLHPSKSMPLINVSRTAALLKISIQAINV
jgi:hypothetical protein